MPQEAPSASCDALVAIKQDLARFEDQPHLRLSVREHYTHLTKLAENLRSLGLDELVIDQEIIGIFERYQSQLMGLVADRAQEGGRSHV